ncbi:MAG TPA: FAD-binding oxidoreductase [Methylomirabilota bacterium]|jgi:glycolate oxidase FAD binding subunit|nr:FAD-binding oxidoreductase [Methylomirabilota bacterium]
MAVTTPGLGGALRSIVGSEHLVEGGAPVDGIAPRWTAAPATVEQAAALVALAHDERLAVAPRGGGSALELGHPPARVDLVLDTRRLDAVLEYNPDDLTVSVQAGCRAGVLAAHLAGRRQLLPLDPPGWTSRTLGGIAATQASGPLRQRYGTMRDLLLGVRFAQADGVLTWGGAKVVKSVSGYDVPKLMVGALGTLGVVLELTLRLHPAPDYEGTWLASFRTSGDAQECVAALLDSTVQTNRLEVLDGRVLAACNLPISGAALAISIGTVEPAVRAQEALVKALVQRAHGVSQTMGASFWRTYDRALAGFDGVMLRVGTLPTRLVETLGAVQAVLPGAAVAGAAGLGALRVLATHADAETLVPALERLRATVARVDGGVVIERAPRALRERLDPWGPVPAPALAVMRALKGEFDPRAVLNPGRYVGGL